MSSDTETIPCPVCSKKFFVSEIEEHANRCIFLNSENPSSNTSKRLSDQFCSPQSKRKRNVEKIQDSSDRSDLTPSMPHNSDAKENDFEDIGSRNDSIPLAEKMRPCHISNFYGQEHILGLGKALRCLMERGSVPNMILWGPPGCGKTTLAHIIAEQCKSNNERYRFVKLSATMAGTDKVKEVVKIAKNELSSFKRNTLLFLDEIHRFNKLQQDVFLPHLESGVITLIGATTENPSFSLNNALLSRCQVFTFEKLQVEDIMKILQRALSKIGAAILKPGQIVASDISDKNPWAVVQEETVRWLAEMSDGDARIALNSLQLAHRLLRGRQEPEPGAEAVALTLDDIKDCVKRSHLLYDKKGDEHYNIISAVHKSIRASDDNAALYWVTRMIQGGEDPIFIARRLVRAASEDIGLADPAALPLAVSTMQGCQLLGMPECDVLLAQCAIYLARAPKSTEAYKALGRARSAVQEHRGPQPGVPLHLRNAPTRLMRELGYGKGYNMAHRDVSNLQYMPEGLEHLNFF